MNITLRNIKILEYLKRNNNLLNEKEEKYLLSYKGNLDEDIRRYPDYFRQIFDELGFIQDKDNIYLAFINLIEEIFPLDDRDILEVGGGKIPSLAKKISLRQTTGTITVYDPRLYREDNINDRFILKKQKFDNNTSLEGIDLIIGFMPCEAADIMIERAIENRIDFMIALCEGGPHGDIYDFYESDEEWRDSLMYYADTKLEELNLGRLGEKSLLKYKNPYPVIYNKKN